MSLKPIIADLTDLFNDVNKGALKSSATAADTTLTVYSISSFAVDQVLCIGELGQEGSEIIKTHSGTSPTGNTVTLLSGLVKSHPKDTPVYILDYDQVEFSHADTVGGSKIVLTTVSINPEQTENYYNDSTYTTGYYFTRYYNSISASYSAHSDPAPYAGWGANTVGGLINIAMSETGKNFTDTLTYEMLLDEINSCLRYVRGKLKRWSNVQTFNYELDSALIEDDYTWTLPTDYYDPNSNRSCTKVWLEDQTELTYADKREFDDYDRDAESGTPKYYTIYDGSIYITPKVGSDYAGDSIYMDYYTEIVEVDSDSDEITLARHDLVKHWLKWQIRNITENNGQPNLQDGDFAIFQGILADAVRRESSGQKYKLKPFVNGINYGSLNSSNFDIE